MALKLKGKPPAETGFPDDRPYCEVTVGIEGEVLVPTP
jgi:hypothetical protein